MDVLRKKVCALKFRKRHTKSEKKKKKIFCQFLFIRMERNARISSNLVYCLKISYILKVQEVPQ